MPIRELGDLDCCTFAVSKSEGVNNKDRPYTTKALEEDDTSADGGLTRGETLQRRAFEI